MHKIISIFLFLLVISTQKLLRANASGQIMKGYRSDLYIGQPPRLAANLTLDTGSSLTIIPCVSCVKCNGQIQNIYYNQQISFSSRKPQCIDRQPICNTKCTKKQKFCEFQITYLEGTSVLGNIIEDKVSFSSNLQKFVAFFGCITIQNSVHPKEEAGGIIGLSPIPQENMLYPLFKQYSEYNYQFSTCFSDNSGFFEVGVDEADAQLKPTWISRFDPSDKIYLLKDLTTMLYGSFNMLGNSNQQVLVDTGSSFIMVSEKMYQYIQSDILNRCDRLQGKCAIPRTQQSHIVIGLGGYTSFQMAKADLNKMFQSISMLINGVKVVFKPSQYFLLYMVVESTLILIAAFGKTQGVTTHYILGLNWMQRTKLTFNLKQQTIKAFYNYSCEYVPLPRQDNRTFSQTVSYYINTIRNAKIEYLIIAFISISFLAFGIKVYFLQIKARLINIKNYIVEKCKTKKENTANRSNVQLNEQSVRHQQSAQIPQQKSTLQQPRQNPTVPKAFKQRRGRKPIKK